MKRIHEPAGTAANDAVRQARIMNRHGFVCLFAAFFSGNRPMGCRRGDDVCIAGGSGTLIHNGICCPSLAIGSLTVPLIKPSFESFAMAKVCSSPLFPAGLLTASIAAVLMAPITMAANAKECAALVPSANPLSQNIFSSVSHSHLKARLDNGRQTCQLSYGCTKKPPMQARCCHWALVGGTIEASSARPSVRDYTKMMLSFTPSAWMMLRVLIPAGV
jgi:hypothetical protein